jgi:peptidoglycan/xylan/chitin deacetylase (PgdA/CDA1 family)
MTPAAAVARSLGVAEGALAGDLDAATLEALAARLRPGRPGAPVRLLRRLAGTALPHVPFALKRAATGTAKRLRQAFRSKSPLSVAELPLVRLAGRVAGAPRRGRVELSHDVDWPSCYAFVEELAALEEAKGVRATFLFLTRDGYTVDKGLVRDLAARGFAIGVHGLTHDVAIGFRSSARIKDHLARAREALGVDAKIYRAPGLGASERLFAILEELGFAVDGSLTVRGTGTVFPYEVPGSRLREHPLALQDDQLFRDQRLRDEEALSAATALLEAVLAVGGSFVFNGHPTLVKEHRAFFEAFLDAAKARAPLVPFGAPLVA